MGKQISFYFGPQDELALAEFLCSKPLACIPSTCATPHPELHAPDAILTLDVKLIHRDYAELAIRNMHTPNNHY